jgi:hypothetical protein
MRFGLTEVWSIRLTGSRKHESHPDGYQPAYEIRISCHVALEKAACAPFSEERRVKLAEATKFHRKSGLVTFIRMVLGLRTGIFVAERAAVLGLSGKPLLLFGL